MSAVTLGVVLLTYNRLDYALKTLRALHENLVIASTINVHYHIASDGDSPEYFKALLKEFPKNARITLSNSMRGGYGKNYNLAMQSVHPNVEYALVLEDDWELVRKWRIEETINALSELGGGCVRLGYIGYTQPLRAQFVTSSSGGSGGDGHWLRLDPQSPEPHVFAGHPRLETVEWARNVGPWPENLNPGETEFAVAHNPKSRERVYWPIPLVTQELFAHIGTVRAY